MSKSLYSLVLLFAFKINDENRKICKGGVEREISNYKYYKLI